MESVSVWTPNDAAAFDEGAFGANQRTRNH